MSESFVRVYSKFDVNFVKNHLLIYGDVSAQCANCQATDLNINDSKCPKCNTEFKYISFRRVSNHLPKLKKISAERPSMQIIDFDDYTRNMSTQKARDFLK